MIDVDIRYLAGLFDGEGWFRINKSKRKDIRWPYAFQVHAEIALREKEILEVFQQRFGGTLRQLPKRSPKHSTYYMWRITGESVVRFVDEIGPYLVLKRQHAELAAEFQAFKREHGNKPLTKEEYDVQLSFFNRMRELNKKGVGKSLEVVESV